MPWRKANTLRARLSLVLIFTLLSMSLAHAGMGIMPMTPKGEAMSMHGMHGQAQMADHAVSPQQQQQHHSCHCGAHCGMCGVCYSVPITFAMSAFIGVGASPFGPRLSNLVELYLPPDPYPPRA